MNRIHFFTFLILLFVLSCTKPPDYPTEPVLEFVSMTKNTMQQSFLPSDDSLKVTISFTDGDGDIGLKDTLPHKITLLDTRFQNHNEDQILTIAIPYVPEQGAGNGISAVVIDDSFFVWSG